MNYQSLKATATSLIQENGLRITLTRDDSDVARSYGVFVGSGSKDYSAPMTSSISGTTKEEKYMIIAGDIKVKPEVGDLITSKNGTYSIIEVQETKPANVTTHYKVKLSQ